MVNNVNGLVWIQDGWFPILCYVGVHLCMIDTHDTPAFFQQSIMAAVSTIFRMSSGHTKKNFCFRCRCEWELFFSFLQRTFFFSKNGQYFPTKKKLREKKNAASLLASKKDTRWTGNRSYFRVASIGTLHEFSLFISLLYFPFYDHMEEPPFPI